MGKRLMRKKAAFTKARKRLAAAITRYRKLKAKLQARIDSHVKRWKELMKKRR